jgi:hypothetical protein
MGLEIKDAAGQLRQEKIQALHRLLVRELRRRENEAKTAPEPPRKDKAPTLGKAFVTLALAVVVPRLIGTAVWGSIYDEPHWWNLLNAILIIGGITDVITAVKARVNAS